MSLGDRVVKCHPMVPTAWPLNRAWTPCRYSPTMHHMVSELPRVPMRLILKYHEGSCIWSCVYSVSVPAGRPDLADYRNHYSLVIEGEPLTLFGKKDFSFQKDERNPYKNNDQETKQWLFFERNFMTRLEFQRAFSHRSKRNLEDYFAAGRKKQRWTNRLPGWESGGKSNAGIF